MPAPAAEISAASKRFGGTQALDGVSLVLKPGTIHAIVGENGAGKSTLIKILGGVHRPDRGQVAIGGAAREFHSPADALASGVAVVSQEIRLVPGLSVAENVMLGHLPARRSFGVFPVVDNETM